jgi:hypothetical protein
MHKQPYALTRSRPFVLAAGEEKRQDLTLRRAPRPPRATITGFVFPRGARPGAIVKLLSARGRPLEHTAPDPRSGLYAFGPLRAGRYRVAAVAPGYRVFLGPVLTLRAHDQARQDLCLRKDRHAEAATVEGTVVSGSGHPQAGVTVALIREATDDRCRERLATVTIRDGEYLLPCVPAGVYQLAAFKRGYLPYREELAISPGAVVEREVVLVRRTKGDDPA